MKQKIYVHVADDHKILIEGIIAVINTNKNIEISGYSLTGQKVIDWFSNNENKADVLILDITMPVLDGFDVLKHFQKKRTKPNIIILSSYDDAKIVQEVMDLGASGYISKNNAGEHIVKAILAVANGDQYFSDDIKQIMMTALLGNKGTSGNLPEKYLFDSLTTTEKQVMSLVAKELSTGEIAEKMKISHHTVESHRKQLLKKLDVKNSIGLAMYAVKYKLV
ncbi:MAG: response regulator transcription factor [Polaribacter sp.]|jgi:two-component system, NarL family, invasion response regulator UvrY|uniref:response regulator n=1 Tax=Polaribacter sp. TaxID=1920175 RepID=UPI002638CE28|nr:response regulator transcription factor [uncultured Polaribacter sp.]